MQFKYNQIKVCVLISNKEQTDKMKNLFVQTNTVLFLFFHRAREEKSLLQKNSYEEGWG